jgi:hypothetical protein
MSEANRFEEGLIMIRAAAFSKKGTLRNFDEIKLPLKIRAFKFIYAS